MESGMIYIYAMRIQNGDQHGTAELLLNRSLEQCTDVQTPARYHRNEHGKPYLTETPEIYVNWSHSGDYVICAVADREVGIDLQKMDREPKENLIRKALTKEEQEKYDNSMMVMWDNYAVYKHAEEKEAKKVSKEIALNLLTYNTPIDVIAKSTGLSIEEIKKLEQ